MSSYIPSMPTLANIAINDQINLGGQTYGITNVADVVDNGNGQITAQVTLDDDNTTVLSLSSADTVIQSYSINQAGVQTAVWSQTEQA